MNSIGVPWDGTLQEGGLCKAIQGYRLNPKYKSSLVVQENIAAPQHDATIQQLKLETGMPHNGSHRLRTSTPCGHGGKIQALKDVTQMCLGVMD